jgi:hypothetical protein
MGKLHLIQLHVNKQCRSLKFLRNKSLLIYDWTFEVTTVHFGRQVL